MSHARVVRASVQHQDRHASEPRRVSYQAHSRVVGQDWFAALRQFVEVRAGVLARRSDGEDGVSRYEQLFVVMIIYRAHMFRWVILAIGAIKLVED